MILICGAQQENSVADSQGSVAIQIQTREAQGTNYDSDLKGAGEKNRFRFTGLRGNSDSDS